MSEPPRLRLSLSNVAGGRLTDGGGHHEYADADRTDVFAQALSARRPDLVVLSELDCGPGSTQIDRLSAGAFGTPDVHKHQEPWSESHVPGVRSLGLGIASRFPLRDIQRVDLPAPSFPLLSWDGKEGRPKRLPWHAKGLLIARCATPGGDVCIVAAHLHPIHIARSPGPEGVPYSYDVGAGLEFGQRTARIIGKRLAALGDVPVILAGDMNMPDPRGLFTHLGGVALADAFGPGEPPATTPDGRSIDRAFVSGHLTPLAHRVVPVPGADHFVVAFEMEYGRGRATRPPALARTLGETPGMSTASLEAGRQHAPVSRRPGVSSPSDRPHPRRM
ncbi:endonuclease/exonuclease/phosphatase family protein [Nocardiopsis sp. NPDC050513]|uniref:endonuclease/exonuclease/phosphatase family protein n=1 Tax=Nocardiopsis sp. NPDC050513 TaxID=3364338 RepID=UPI00378E976E